MSPGHAAITRPSGAVGAGEGPRRRRGSWPAVAWQCAVAGAVPGREL